MTRRWFVVVGALVLVLLGCGVWMLVGGRAWAQDEVVERIDHHAGLVAEGLPEGASLAPESSLPSGGECSSALFGPNGGYTTTMWYGVEGVGADEVDDVLKNIDDGLLAAGYERGFDDRPERASLSLDSPDGDFSVLLTQRGDNPIGVRISSGCLDVQDPLYL